MTGGPTRRPIYSMEAKVLLAVLAASVVAMTGTVEASRSLCLDQAVGASTARVEPEATSDADDLQDLYARVEQLTGLERRDCGNFIRRSARDQAATTAQLESAVACAQAAASEHVAFWFASGGFVVESWQVEGLLAGPDGILQHFVYNSFGPSVHATRCSRPRVAEPSGLARQIVCGTND